MSTCSINGQDTLETSVEENSRALSGEMQTENWSKYEKYTMGCYCVKGQVFLKLTTRIHCVKSRQGPC